MTKTSKPRNILMYREHTNSYKREGGVVKWVMGINECTCDEQWMLYVSVEALYFTPETIML